MSPLPLALLSPDAIIHLQLPLSTNWIEAVYWCRAFSTPLILLWKIQLLAINHG